MVKHLTSPDSSQSPVPSYPFIKVLVLMLVLLSACYTKTHKSTSLMSHDSPAFLPINCLSSAQISQLHKPSCFHPSLLYPKASRPISQSNGSHLKRIPPTTCLYHIHPRIPQMGPSSQPPWALQPLLSHLLRTIHSILCRPPPVFIFFL